MKHMLSKNTTFNKIARRDIYRYHIHGVYFMLTFCFRR